MGLPILEFQVAFPQMKLKTNSQRPNLSVEKNYIYSL